MSSSLFACRQPIFDRRLNVIGYELLYRSYAADQAQFTDGDRATTQVILNAFAEFGLEAMVGNRKAFINLTRNFILDRYPIPFPAQHMVLEVLEGITIDDTLLRFLYTLSQRGFQIALDDVASPTSLKPLLNLADIIKVDLLATDRSRLTENVRFLRQYRAKLLAEKVETQRDLDLCKRLGFDYFQGYFLCRPNIIRGRAILPARLVILRLVSKLLDPEIDYGKLEEIIAQDVTLSYKLLRLVNSASFGIPMKINSIRQAMAFLGIDQLRGWLTLFLMSDTADKPRELTILALTRAKMCELLARACRMADSETYFLVGLFSVLDALMDLPIEQVLSTLRLSDAICAALMEGYGPMGSALGCTLNYERAAWDQVGFLNLDPGRIRDIYLETLGWVAGIEKTLEL
jgi:EAL and modified HD-GYP domain-containing signal transduction protein